MRRGNKEGAVSRPLSYLLLGDLLGLGRALLGHSLGGFGSSFFHRHMYYPLSGEIFLLHGAGRCAGNYQGAYPADATGLLTERPGQTPSRDSGVLRFEEGSAGRAPTSSEFTLRLSCVLFPRSEWAICRDNNRWFISLISLKERQNNAVEVTYRSESELL